MSIIKCYMQPIILLAIIGVIIIVILTALIFLMIRFQRKLNLFTTGSNGSSLESVMQELLKKQENSQINHKKLYDIVQTIHNRVTTSHRGFALMKYNAYENIGGNQSFSFVLLDENGTGMVLSSLYSRERSNVFAKPISQFKSEIELTRDEQKVLKQAMESLQ